LKNAADRELATKIGREVTEASLGLGRRGRVWVEAQTDGRGHVRSHYRIEKVVTLTGEDDRGDLGEPR
jgi:hypothetical protein